MFAERTQFVKSYQSRPAELCSCNEVEYEVGFEELKLSVTIEFKKAFFSVLVRGT